MRLLHLTTFAVAFITTGGGAARAERLDLDALRTRARRHARVEAVRAAANAAHAKADQVSLAWIPHLEVTMVGGPSPEIRCQPSPEECTRTTPTETSIGFGGAFFRIDATAAMPIFTFGKLSSGRRAAEAGARAADALAQAAEAEAALEATRAYWGVKLARELLLMLDEGMDELDKELERIDGALKKGSPDVTESDRHRLRAVRAEVESRVSEARRGERVALAGVRFFAVDDTSDVDEKPLEAVQATVPAREEARARAVGRPEKQAAEAGVAAASELVDLEKARWLPDLVALAQGTFARSSSTDDPANAFYTDPFHVSGVTAGVVVRWSLDPGQQPAKVAGARAEEARARATAAFAASGLAAEADRAWADATDAHDRLDAARRGEKEARAFLVATLQSLAAGLAEPKDLPDALLLYFTMRARTLQATFDWNVGLAALERATGGR